MRKEFHWLLNEFVSDVKLPIYVTLEGHTRKHIERLFHDHTSSEIAVVVRGSAIHLLENRLIGDRRNNYAVEQVAIRKGDVLVIHPGVTHCYDQTDDFELLNIVYDTQQLAFPHLDCFDMPFFHVLFPQGALGDPAEQAHPVMRLDEEQLNAVLLQAQRLQNEIALGRAGNLFVSLTLFLECMAMISRYLPQRENEPEGRKANFLIGAAISFMVRHYAEKITLERLAKQVNMSSRNFCRHFRNATGSSPMEYLNNIRLTHALLMVQDSRIGIEEIAGLCGYCGNSHLYRMFRAAYGVSPREYRKGKRAAVQENCPPSPAGIIDLSCTSAPPR